MSRKPTFPTESEEARAYEIAKITGFTFDGFCGSRELRYLRRLGDCEYVMYVAKEPGPIKIIKMHIKQDGGPWQHFESSFPHLISLTRKEIIMMWTIAQVRTNKRTPHLTDWVVILTPEMIEQHCELSTGLSRSMFMRAIQAPHLPQAEPKACIRCEPEKAFFEHIAGPIVLSARWMTATTNQLLFKRQAINVNKMGGWHLHDPNAVIQKYESDSLIFPGMAGPGSTITISRYPDRPHWYLHPSWQGIIYPNKFNTVKQAVAFATLIVGEERAETAVKVITRPVSA